MNTGMRLLAVLIACAYIAFVLVTLLQSALWIRILSPITALLAAALVGLATPRLGSFKACGGLVTLGILCWGAGDVVQLIDVFALGVDPFTQGIAPTLYLFPNYCFGGSLAWFIVRKMSKSRLASFLLTSLIFTVIGLIFYRKNFLLRAANEGVTIGQSSYLRIMLYLAINIYILVMVIYLVITTEKKSLRISSVGVMVSIFLYILIDFRYTFVEYLGRNPENVYMDLIYMFCMVGLAFCVTDQAYNPGDMRAGEQKSRSVNLHRVKRIVSLGTAALWVLLYLTSYLSLTEFLVLLIMSMAYAIMSFSEEANQLSEQLLQNEREVSKRLEEQVREKTKDLQDANAHLERVSSTDTLTGLYNRRYGKRLLDELMQGGVEGRKFAVFSIDLNYFKPINDNYGHDMGDKVLATVGQRLLKFSDRFTSFRFGGDEFLVIQEYQDDGFTVGRTADILRTIFDRKIVIGIGDKTEAESGEKDAADAGASYEFLLSASIGISRFPQDAQTIDELLRCADTAMYSVKHRSRKTDICYYEAGMVEDESWRADFEKDLSEIDPDEDFYLHYQPQLDVRTGALSGIEVLLRFRRKGGYVAVPQTLIETAEDTGLMVKFGDWVIEHAIEKISEWNRRYHIQQAVTINISAIQLADAEFIPKLLAAMKRYDARPSWVNFELRKSAIMDSGMRSASVCTNLHELGFSLSADSVDAGAISPSALLAYHIDRIKLSERLVADIGINEHIDSSAVVSALLGLANGLGIEACASGVENELQKRVLEAMGFRLMQGFYFREPVEPEFLEATYLKEAKERHE